MHDTYTKLMMRQDLSQDVDVVFYEKLELTQSKKKPKPILRVAIVAACLCLLIPVTVYAINFLTHDAQTRETHSTMEPLPTDSGLHDWRFRYVDVIPTDDFEINFGDLKRFSIKEFPRNVRKANSMVVHYDSWDQAVDDLDLGYLKNTVLADDETTPTKLRVARTYGEEPTHCMMEYVGLDDQPCLAYLHANYERNDIEFTILANIGIEHPTALEEYYEMLHTHGYGMPHRDRPNYEHETYTTANGIPVTITKTTTNQHHFHCSAYFAVNNISYTVDIGEWSFSPLSGEEFETPEEKVMATLKEVLEGFTIE